MTTEISGGLSRLKSEVLDSGLCVACGACLGLCPHMIFLDGRLAAPDDCGLGEGRCWDLCPQAAEPAPDRRRAALARARGLTPEGDYGQVLALYEARAMEGARPAGAQYGGVVSTLLALALEAGLVGEAVATGPGPAGAPVGRRLTDPAEARALAGSLYAAGAALGEVNRALAEEADHALAVVGLPCQILAAAAMQSHPRYPAAGRLKLLIGLFCTLNLDARRLRSLLAAAGVDAAQVTRADFPPPPAGVLQVWSGGKLTEIPLTQVDQAVLAGCRRCPDLTAELADVSVGAREGRPGWNTLVVRTPAGRELVELAAEKGLLELHSLPADYLAGLAQAARNKASRARAAWKER
ncbi:MAG: Coenzyme F420 hydrogenase/dehydrogenase, beta subunit C-terminal domain [Deltaproteobacteria bacterium]|nr:Coenzyme F420 hydrogenase/dehydrogenase, beta subunit C-terminal domain [Deltaproteobacteria bacterium]